MEAETDRARAIPMPAVFFGLLVLGFILDWVHPVTLGSNLAFQVAGVAVIVFGLVIGSSGVIAMKSAHTTLSVGRIPTTALVEKGIFRHTRNPLYLSMLIIFLGIAIFTTVLWLILLLPILFLIADRGAARPEESYLERKFGQVYLQYKKRVPRWV